MAKDRNAAGGWITASVVVGSSSLFVMYFLSAGPMYWLASRGYVDTQIINLVYYPIVLLCENCHPFGRLFKTYVNLIDP